LQRGIFLLFFAAARALNIWQYQRPPAVIVIRVDDAGRAEAIRYKTGEYTPREAEIVSRLNEWAIDRFRLLKSVIDQDFKKNYLFLESRLARELMGT
jgi:type IV secretory pathway TrbF-like protein